MIGNIVNFFAIVIGASVGALLGRKVPQAMGETIIRGISLAVIVIGLSMALEGTNPVVTILAIVLGTVVGELVGFEHHLQRFGNLCERKFSKENGTFAKGFVTASLIYCVGAMAIMGALEAGISGDWSILAIKAMLDGISAVIFAATMGIGVAFSALPVLFYQGTITLFAVWLSSFLDATMIREMSAVGGVLIMGIGLNMLEVTGRQIRVGYMLPAIPAVVLIAWLAQYFFGWS